MVVLARVEGELAAELALDGEDADVHAGDEDDDAFAAVVSADADVMQLGFVAEGDVAAAVDGVAADACVA